MHNDYEMVYHLPLTFERNKLIYETKVNVLHFARTLKAVTIIYASTTYTGLINYEQNVRV